MKILFGVFDWGIGHATRDMPLIEQLLKKHEVHIISRGRALTVLKDYFKKKCVYYEVPSLYDIYTKNKHFKLGFALAIPKIIKSLEIAKKESRKIIDAGKFDIVISDCRYDVFDTPENSYLINHQLRFMAPFPFSIIMEKWLEKNMNHYKYVIVPDYEKENLSGDLSHNLRYFSKDKIKYIGIFSQLKKKKVKENIDYFFSLSGPEQTRAELEKKVLDNITELKGNIVIAGGVPEARTEKKYKNVNFCSFLNREQQQKMMNSSKFIIIRAGYTTVMELVELDKKALLIASPGQTEQEYLVRYYEKKGFFHYADQSKLKLKEDIEKAKKSKGFVPEWKTEKSVRNFMKIIGA